MADHPLRPTTDHRLGMPLPHQLTNQTRAHIQADFSVLLQSVLGFNLLYSYPEGRFSRVTHPSATKIISYDLHVLSLPLAFILSQDQTLRCNYNFNFVLKIASLNTLSLIHI